MKAWFGVMDVVERRRGDTRLVSSCTSRYNFYVRSPPHPREEVGVRVAVIMVVEERR